MTKSTGIGRGGKRPGAGRKATGRNTLEMRFNLKSAVTKKARIYLQNFYGRPVTNDEIKEYFIAGFNRKLDEIESAMAQEAGND